MSNLNYNATEKDQEVYILLSAIEIIDAIINRSVLEIRLDNENRATIQPKNYIAEKYFFIFVNDFFSKVGIIVPKGNQSIFELLINEVCQKHLLTSTAYRPLIDALHNLEEWYFSAIAYTEFYFPNFNMEMTLTVKRSDSINILSNMSKHNLTKLDGIRKIIKQIFINNPNDKVNHILQDDSNLIIASRDFYNQFMSESSSRLVDLLIGLTYHLNKIRIEIYNYLSETYLNSYEILPPENGLRRYKFDRPEGLSDIGYGYYWELMDWRGSSLIVGDFEIDDCYKDKKALL